MSRIRYFSSKVLRAWFSGTLLEKSSRFLVTMFRRPFVVMTGYFSLSKADRSLNIKDAFADHRLNKYHSSPNPEFLRRIIAAYKAAKQAQPLAALPFQIRGLWDEWITINHKKLITALETEDVLGLSIMLENLFREQFTIGTGGYDTYVRYHTLLGPFYIKYVWCSYRNKLLALDFDFNIIDFPLVGNPTGILLNERVIPIETLRHAYHAVEMCKLLTNVPNANIVEIGGGFGGQAYQTIQMSGKQISKYLVFDIPEVAVISSYLLLSAFPKKRVRLFGEGSVSVDSSEEFDIAIFPHFTITQLSDSSVDLFYNSCSFSEMDGASSAEYLSVIERTCRKYFMHDNHDTTFKYSYPDGSTSVNIIGSQLLPDATLFKRIFKKPRVHYLPEDKSFIQFEFLYERL